MQIKGFSKTNNVFILYLSFTIRYYFTSEIDFLRGVFWLNIDKSNQIRLLITDSIIFNDFKRLNYITVLT